MRIETNIGRVRRLAAEKEEENWRFRSFLKATDLSIEEVDAAVRRLDDEISQQINCMACANCCRSVFPELLRRDIARLARSLRISEEELLAQYLEPTEFGGKHKFKSLPCPFLSGNRCTVYDDRPEDCRSYPHLHKDEFVTRLMGVVSNCSVCPIVYNVFERLKDELWHAQEDHLMNGGPEGEPDVPEGKS